MRQKMLPDRSMARAKINLFLHVTARRDDGYHELDSLVVFAETADELALAAPRPAGSGMSLEIDGPFGAGLEAGPDNLVLRAAEGLRKVASLPEGAPDWQIRLTKNLPWPQELAGGRLMRRLRYVFWLRPGNVRTLILLRLLPGSGRMCLSVSCRKHNVCRE